MCYEFSNKYFPTSNPNECRSSLRMSMLVAVFFLDNSCDVVRFYLFKGANFLFFFFNISLIKTL